MKPDYIIKEYLYQEFVEERKNLHRIFAGLRRQLDQKDEKTEGSTEMEVEFEELLELEIESEDSADLTVHWEDSEE